MSRLDASTASEPLGPVVIERATLEQTVAVENGQRPEYAGIVNTQGQPIYRDNVGYFIRHARPASPLVLTSQKEYQRLHEKLSRP